MTPINPMMHSLQKLVIDMSLINRRHLFPGTERFENDTEHSFAVTMLCWYICSRYQLPLDLSKVLTYALTHDFAERYAGDTNTYASKAARQKKIELEAMAIDRLSGEFSDFSDMVNALQAYEAKSDEESRFVWTVDKMQALILGDMDNWRAYQRKGIDYETFKLKQSEHLKECSIYCKEIFEALVDHCVNSYYDSPVHYGSN